MAIIKKYGLTYQDEVVIGEHRVKLPPLPDRKEILFIDNDYEDASWNIVDKHGKIIKTRRQEFPEIWYGYMPYDTAKLSATIRYTEGTSAKTQATIWDKKNSILKSLSKEDTQIIDNIYSQELKRMRDGVFFRNGDDIEYLTPAHYTTLQWCKMTGLFKNGGYGFFFKYQRDVFYLLDHQWTIYWCRGLDLSKAKKIGITQIIGGGYIVWAAITHFQWVISMMSRSEPVANGTSYAYFLHAFNGLPIALMPKVSFLAPKGGDITFGERTRAGILSTEDNVLNTRVMTVPTAEHAFDSFFPMLVWCDEFPKYWGDSKKEPKKILDENINSIMDQLTVRGRFLITSYPPEKNDLGAQQAKTIYYESKLSTRLNGEGKTTSGLICYHIPGNESVKDLQDRFGNALVDQANKMIDTELKKKEGDRDGYLATLRVFCRNEREAFDLPARGNGLPIMRLIELKADLEIQERIDPNLLYLEGRFVWANEMWELIPGMRKPGKFCPVKFIPLTDEELAAGIKGRSKIFNTGAAFTPNTCLLNGYDEWGNLLPPAIFENVGSADPTNWATKSEIIEGSKNCFHTMNLPNPKIDQEAKQIVTNVLMSEYFFRAETPDEGKEDLVKEIIFFGKLNLIEGNSPSMFNEIMKEKLGYYMIVKDKDAIYLPWERDMGMYNEPDKKYVSPKTQANADAKVTLNEFFSLYAKYFRKPVSGDRNVGATCKSTLVMDQAINLDPEDTRKSDAFMSFGWLLKAVEIYLDYLIHMTEKDYNITLPFFLQMLAKKSA